MSKLELEVKKSVALEKFTKLPQLLEGLLLAAGKPLTEAELLAVFDEAEKPALSEFRQAIYSLQQAGEERGYELVQLASGYQLRVKPLYAKWVSRLFSERPPKYSRALLETLALIAYRQPITRGEIEDIRGVGVSTSIFRTLDERNWIRVVGKRDVPGKPALYATTKQFLDYFWLKSLDELPALPEVMKMEAAKNLELEFGQQEIVNAKVHSAKQDENYDPAEYEDVEEDTEELAEDFADQQDIEDEEYDVYEDDEEAEDDDTEEDYDEDAANYDAEDYDSEDYTYNDEV